MSKILNKMQSGFIFTAGCMASFQFYDKLHDILSSGLIFVITAMLTVVSIYVNRD